MVRISGPQADAALEALAGTLPEPRRATLASLRDGGEVLDKALVIRFPGPASATGEDVAELHLHGGRAVVAAVLAALGRDRRACAPAEPGEFTRRAFENGRIDLAEAEGLADLLDGRDRVAAPGGAGPGRRRAQPPGRGLAGASCSASPPQVEAALDFSDEDDVGADCPRLATAQLEALADEIAASGSPARRPSGSRKASGWSSPARQTPESRAFSMP